MFEGGHKVRSFVYDGGNNLEPSFYEGMFHSVDWLPTILSAAINRPVGKIFHKSKSKNSKLYMCF